MGNGSIGSSGFAEQVPGVPAGYDVAGGDRHSLVLTAAGDIWSFGFNETYELGYSVQSWNEDSPVMADMVFCPVVATIADDPVRSTFAVMPNPSTGMIIVVCTGGPPPEEVAIHDAAGRRIFLSQWQNGQMTIDLSEHLPGFYYVMVRSLKCTSARRLVKL